MSYCEADEDREGRDRGVTPDSDELGAHDVGASQFVRTAAYGPPVKDRPRRNRIGTGPAMAVATLVARAAKAL
jgi:hypothetical protein